MNLFVPCTYMCLVSQAIIQVQQLRQELQHQKDRYDKYVTSAKERAVKDQETTKSEYLKQMDALNSKVG